MTLAFWQAGQPRRRRPRRARLGPRRARAADRAPLRRAHLRGHGRVSTSRPRRPSAPPSARPATPARGSASAACACGSCDRAAALAALERARAARADASRACSTSRSPTTWRATSAPRSRRASRRRALDPESAAAWARYAHALARTDRVTDAHRRVRARARARADDPEVARPASRACATPSRAGSRSRGLSRDRRARPSSRRSSAPASRSSSACPACTTSRAWEALRALADPARRRAPRAGRRLRRRRLRARDRRGSASRWSRPARARRTRSARSGRRGRRARRSLVIATDIPTAPAPRRRAPRRAARVRRPGGDVRAGDQGARCGVERAEDVGAVAARALTQAATPPARPVYLEVPTDLLAAQAAGERPSVRWSRKPDRRLRRGRT